ncbi:hypothetical protein L596_012718 [Steinernema carpocapsae]|uniref:Uncharacterized protein n=1 Tax=Steinernema carpocapsae TaxID=34508 RepID=A0A4U5NYU9_STECR|nr:hypothetical protein L596_012718 [Steinernema carpocapsae]
MAPPPVGGQSDNKDSSEIRRPSRLPRRFSPGPTKKRASVQSSRSTRSVPPPPPSQAALLRDDLASRFSDAPLLLSNLPEADFELPEGVNRSLPPPERRRFGQPPTKMPPKRGKSKPPVERPTRAKSRARKEPKVAETKFEPKPRGAKKSGFSTPKLPAQTVQDEEEVVYSPAAKRQRTMPAKYRENEASPAQRKGQNEASPATRKTPAISSRSTSRAPGRPPKSRMSNPEVVPKKEIVGNDSHADQILPEPSSRKRGRRSFEAPNSQVVLESAVNPAKRPTIGLSRVRREANSNGLDGHSTKRASQTASGALNHPKRDSELFKTPKLPAPRGRKSEAGKTPETPKDVPRRIITRSNSRAPPIPQATASIPTTRSHSLASKSRLKPEPVKAPESDSDDEMPVLEPQVTLTMSPRTSRRMSRNAEPPMLAADRDESSVIDSTPSSSQVVNNETKETASRKRVQVEKPEVATRRSKAEEEAPDQPRERDKSRARTSRGTRHSRPYPKPSSPKTAAPEIKRVDNGIQKDSKPSPKINKPIPKRSKSCHQKATPLVESRPRTRRSKLLEKNSESREPKIEVKTEKRPKRISEKPVKDSKPKEPEIDLRTEESPNGVDARPAQKKIKIEETKIEAVSKEEKTPRTTSAKRKPGKSRFEPRAERPVTRRSKLTLKSSESLENDKVFNIKPEQLNGSQKAKAVELTREVVSSPEAFMGEKPEKQETESIEMKTEVDSPTITNKAPKDEADNFNVSTDILSSSDNSTERSCNRVFEDLGQPEKLENPSEHLSTQDFLSSHLGTPQVEYEKPAEEPNKVLEGNVLSPELEIPKKDEEEPKQVGLPEIKASTEEEEPENLEDSAAQISEASANTVEPPKAQEKVAAKNLEPRNFDPDAIDPVVSNFDSNPEALPEPFALEQNSDLTPRRSSRLRNSQNSATSGPNPVLKNPETQNLHADPGISKTEHETLDGNPFQPAPATPTPKKGQKPASQVSSVEADGPIEDESAFIEGIASDPLPFELETSPKSAKITSRAKTPARKAATKVPPVKEVRKSIPGPSKLMSPKKELLTPKREASVATARTPGRKAATNISPKKATPRKTPLKASKEAQESEKPQEPKEEVPVAPVSESPQEPPKESAAEAKPAEKKTETEQEPSKVETPKIRKKPGPKPKPKNLPVTSQATEAPAKAAETLKTQEETPAVSNSGRPQRHRKIPSKLEDSILLDNAVLNSAAPDLQRMGRGRSVRRSFSIAPDVEARKSKRFSISEVDLASSSSTPVGRKAGKAKLEPALLLEAPPPASEPVKEETKPETEVKGPEEPKPAMEKPEANVDAPAKEAPKNEPSKEEAKDALTKPHKHWKLLNPMNFSQKPQKLSQP